jgi:MoaA/NifB/PqqE/SkfB family radical SAM enzyme
VNLTAEYCRQLVEAQLDSMQVTFYSSDRAVHNTLVGADHYDDTVTGIKNALAAGINLSVNTPLCTLNMDYVHTLEFLHALGVEYVSCSGLIVTGNATKEASKVTQLSKTQLMEILQAATEYCYAHGMEISFTSPGWVNHKFLHDLGVDTPACGACLSNMAITPDGKVVPCQSWLSDKSLGNMLTKDWHKIWNSSRCKEIRKESARMTGKCPLRDKEEKEA